MPEPPPLTCALAAGHRFDWLAEAALGCAGLHWVALEALGAGVPPANPFGLPVESRADVAVITSDWYERSRGVSPDDALRALEALERRCGTVVALEGYDEFALGLAPEACDRVAVIIKGQGVLKDRERYNEARWRSTADWSGRSPAGYSAAHLDKLVPSIPLFLWLAPGMRRLARTRKAGLGRVNGWLRNRGDRLIAPSGALYRRLRPTLDVHCLGRLTHPDRLTALGQLARFSGEQGITDVPGFVAGLSDQGHYLRPATTSLSAAEELPRAAAPFLVRRHAQVRYTLDLFRHRVVMAPRGYGELTYRHGEALAAGAALVCADVSEFELRFEFRDSGNVFFCRPDLSDLASVVERVLADPEGRWRVAHQGHADFQRWAKSWRSLLAAGIEAPIRRAAGA